MVNRNDLGEGYHITLDPLPESDLEDAVIAVHRLLGPDCDDALTVLGLTSVKISSKYSPDEIEILLNDAAEKEAYQAPR